jgi:hypothetical protein
VLRRDEFLLACIFLQGFDLWVCVHTVLAFTKIKLNHVLLVLCNLKLKFSPARRVNPNASVRERIVLDNTMLNNWRSIRPMRSSFKILQFTTLIKMESSIAIRLRIRRMSLMARCTRI